jgi:hypothetical protein
MLIDRLVAHLAKAVAAFEKAFAAETAGWSNQADLVSFA